MSQPIGSTKRTTIANGISIQEQGKSTTTGSKMYGLGMLSGVSRRDGSLLGMLAEESSLGKPARTEWK